MFDPSAAVDRLLLVRRLRALGLSLVAIGNVLDGDHSIGDVIAAERAALDIELDALRWRRAALLSVENAPQPERAARLELLAAVQDRGAVLDAFVAFWRRVLTPMPVEMFDGFIEMNLPEPPGEPTPHAMLAYAELAGLVADAGVRDAMMRQIWRPGANRIRDRRRFMTELAEACNEAAALVAQEPRTGPELDQFVSVHAALRGERDTPLFRRQLLESESDSDPRLRRYWMITTEVTGSLATVGAVHYWLVDALRRSLESAGNCCSPPDK